MREAATGVAGMAHCVQGLTGIIWGTLHKGIDCHVCRHVRGDDKGSHTLYCDPLGTIFCVQTSGEIGNKNLGCRV
uniref:Uncharacterized protein n=1 Tax=Anguilla anguilla TaxID=7936 RepID=A0A0E9XBU4_ANGAN